MRRMVGVLAGILVLVVGGHGATLTSNVRERCFKILRTGLSGADFWPAMHAAEGLTAAGHGAEVRKLLLPRLIAERDDQRRCGLARELVRAGDVDRSMVLTAILEGRDPHGHVHAAESLFKVGWQGEAACLKEAWQRAGNLRLQLMAAGALAKHGNRAALLFLRRTLQLESDPQLLGQTAWLLGRVGGEPDRVGIRQRLPDVEEAATRAVLEHSLAALGDAEGRKALLRNLTAADVRIRTAAAIFASDARLEAAMPALIGLLDDANQDTRIRAAHSLLVLVR
jgi:sialidase-1